MTMAEINLRDLLELRKAGFQYSRNIGHYIIYKSGDLNLLVQPDYKTRTANVISINSNALEAIIEVYGARK